MTRLPAPGPVPRVAAAGERVRPEAAPLPDRRPAGTSARLAAAASERTFRAHPPVTGTPRGTPPYGAAVYAATDALRARPRGEAVEVSVRHLADGGRLTVARRTDGARTVAIEAQVA